mgnify:CR=1 FL=1
MLIYEVNLQVEASSATAFAQWLSPHIQEMLAFDGFLKARWFQRDPADDSTVENVDTSEFVFWTVHYFVKDRAALDDYFLLHAARMREDGLRLFSGKFSASRRILQSYRDFEKS